MKKAILLLICLALCALDAEVTLSKETKNKKMLPPVVAQTYGPAGTIIMWHDTNNDGKPDVKATYVFIDGRLCLIDKSVSTDANFNFKKPF